MIKKRVQNALEKALEARLSVLTLGLSEAEITGKGIDIVKEIKELNGLLINLEQGLEVKENKNSSPRLMVVWANEQHDAQNTRQDNVQGKANTNVKPKPLAEPTTTSKILK